MKKTWKKILAFALCLVMLLGTVAVGGNGLIEAVSVRASAEESTSSYEVGDIVEYGYYPQTKVTNAALIENLNNAKGVWQSYRYLVMLYPGKDLANIWYHNYVPKYADYMKYKDVVYNGEAYRAVTFSDYRPDSPFGYESCAQQYLNGYFTDEVYWFKYEPLKWKILDPDMGLAQCATVIDSQPFNNGCAIKTGDDYEDPKYIDNEGTAYASNYGKSSLNTWLNSSFLDTAFSSLQQENLQETRFCRESDDTANAYDISVKSFLLSLSEQTNAAYGFSTKESRKKGYTDYAFSQGFMIGYSGEGYWTRTGIFSYGAYDITMSGGTDKSMSYGITVGVVPAVKFESFEENCDHNYVLTDVEGNCLSEGYQTYKCTECGAEFGGHIETYEKADHVIVTEPYVAPTCLDTGLTEGRYCSACGTVFSTQEVIPATGHIDENGDEVCDVCGYKPEIVRLENVTTGADIEFGSYPQSQVTSEALISALNADEGEWISYNYYSGTGSYNGAMTASDYMKYKDVTLDGVKYRGVIFTSYRPGTTAGKAGVASSSYQDDNGYSAGTAYWFKYEPLTWRVLNPSTGMVMCESIIDSQPYQNYVKSSGSNFYADSDCTVYANDYENSSIRQWLNDDFYNTAFSDEEKALIEETTITNSANNYTYDSASTTDNVYLVSYADLHNTDYGFTEMSNTDAGRIAAGTAYAKIQGLFVNTDLTGDGYDYRGNSIWMMRTAGSSSYSITYANYDGKTADGAVTFSTSYGIRPVISIDTQYNTASSTECSHAYTSYVGLPTCEESGRTTYVCMKCGYSYDEITPALGHSHAVSEEVPATCTTAGRTQGDYCTRCGKVFTSQETIASGDHIFLEYVYNDDATATLNGTKTATCSVCGTTDTVEAENTALIRSISVSSNEAVRGDTVTWTIVTSSDVTSLRLNGKYTTESGSAKNIVNIFRSTGTSSSLNYTLDETTDTATWVITSKLNYSASDNKVDENFVISCRTESDNSWQAANSGNPTVITICSSEKFLSTAEEETYAPYTLIDVTAPETAAAGTRGTVTVRTTTDCSKVRIGFGTKYATFQTTSANCTVSDADGVRTWTISYKFTTAGDNTYSVSTRGSAWSEAKTFTTAVA